MEVALAEFGLQIRTLAPLPCLSKMASHEAFQLLRTCFTVPKVLHVLRSFSAFAATSVADLSLIIKEVLEAIINTYIDETSWQQASIPVRWDGM